MWRNQEGRASSKWRSHSIMVVILVIIVALIITISTVVSIRALLKEKVLIARLE